MKRTFVIVIFIALFSSFSFAWSIQFPEKDKDGTDYTLTVYKDRITILGADGTALQSNLPLQY